MTDLIPINISNELIAKLGEPFNPLFSQIRIYGTIDKPIFIARDVERALGLSDINVRHRANFKEGIHYIKLVVPTAKGNREAIAFTEYGMYQVMFSSSVAVAEEYCRFIVIVMKQLRTQGVVTLESALTELQSKVKMLDDETDRQQEVIRDLEDVQERKTRYIAVLENRIADKEAQVEVAEEAATKSGNVEYIDLLEKALMKTVYVYVSGVDEEEALDLPDNDVFLFRLSTKNTLARHHQVAESYMVNPVKQITVLGSEHECSLTDLRDMVSTSNLNYLKNL